MSNYTLQEISDAIRKNGWPKAIGTYERCNANGEVIAACALGQGAINLGITGSRLHSILSGLFRAENNYDYGYLSCPSKRCRFRSVAGSVVTHLNDIHRWKLDRIADWLDTLA